jgi:hypothetical protein
MYFFIFILCLNTIASMINTNPFFDFASRTKRKKRCLCDYARNVGGMFDVRIYDTCGTRCVPSRTDNIMNIQARITLNVEFIRTWSFFIFI